MNHRVVLFSTATLLFLAIDLFASVGHSQNATAPAESAEAAMTAETTGRTASPIGRTASAVNEDSIPEGLQGDFRPGDIAAATEWADRLNLADWLGPLAPLALSPFFGVACLSGLALWGPEAITDNALLGASGPLRSVPLFTIFAILALLTSLPRLSKVSKPFAQAMDRVEAYAVIVILLAIKITSSYSGDATLDSESMALMNSSSPVVMQAGIVSFTAETLLMIAMTINLLVINSVKFFFEFLVWLTPFPTVDAMFEVGNKATCGILMGIYAYSPMLATAINLLVLFFALIVFRWTARRVKFYRTMLLDPVLALVWRAYGLPNRKGLIVFPQDDIGPFPAKSCLRLTRNPNNQPGWSLQAASSWSPLSWMPAVGGGAKRRVTLCEKTPPRLTQGWLTHTLAVKLANPEPGEETTWTLKTSRRHDQHFAVLTETLAVEVAEEKKAGTVHKTEFA
ncbi:hypothetical protein [Neorhodopirellula lusitana]|uniref:hypothetical protein n=1 Tax=Neorhodopirellula lusitana TaxID=445327 RepID=UPI00384EF55B